MSIFDTSIPSIHLRVLSIPRRCETHGRDGGTSRWSGTRLPAAGGKLASTLAPSDASNGRELRFKISDCREIMHFFQKMPGIQRMQTWDVHVISGGYWFLFLLLLFSFLVHVLLGFFPLLFLLLVLCILVSSKSSSHRFSLLFFFLGGCGSGASPRCSIWCLQCMTSDP